MRDKSWEGQDLTPNEARLLKILITVSVAMGFCAAVGAYTIVVWLVEKLT